MTENLALLMPVTRADLPIARYSIRALSKLLHVSNNVTIYLFCNGLKEQEEEEILALSRKINSRMHVISNREKLKSIHNDIRVGEWYVTDQGNREFREGYYENCGEVWTREVIRLPAEIAGMIDADFEILDPSFVSFMREQFVDDPQLAFFSTDYSQRVKRFENYSQTDAHIAARYHTWFCLYRCSALEKYPNFTYVEEEADDGLPLKFDHSAKLQEVLLLHYGYHGKSLNGRFREQYIHYGAFTQNGSLRGGKLWFYRLLRIGAHNGWIHTHKSQTLARIVRRFSSACYVLLDMSRYDKERQRYLFERTR